jgi:hypothetical protein
MRNGWLLLTTFAIGLSAEVVLTNDTVLKLFKAGIGEDSIVGMVNQQPGIYALSTDDLAALKKAGVTQKIIAAMLVRNGAPDVAAIQPVPNAGTKPRLNRNLTSGEAKAGDNAELTISSNPSSAAVEVDGVPGGATPVVKKDGRRRRR